MVKSDLTDVHHLVYGSLPFGFDEALQRYDTISKETPTAVSLRHAFVVKRDNDIW